MCLFSDSIGRSVGNTEKLWGILNETKQEMREIQEKKNKRVAPGNTTLDDDSTAGNPLSHFNSTNERLERLENKSRILIEDVKIIQNAVRNRSDTDLKISATKEDLQRKLDILQKHLVLLNTSLVDKINKISNVAGPVGPPGMPGNPGINGTRGPVGPKGERGFNGSKGSHGPVGPRGSDGSQGVQGPSGPPGTGNFSSCYYKMESSSSISSGPNAVNDVIVKQLNDVKIIGVTCSSNDAQMHTLTSAVNRGSRYFTCRCRGTMGIAAANKMFCYIHYWECRLST
ncbi:uncharacterized protein LOC144634673 isoform X1 [Oculina patagonica]